MVELNPTEEERVEPRHTFMFNSHLCGVNANL